ncbi:hypothetical protein [Limnohabitans sp. T6-20]|uniref:hypothetical protein n=1 Tax=Limnohabitans sp. T6-20 TaxID=1100725 RepID=UPI0011B226B7|nr:hypothetical protein [Limnohabitans sp. T6-20]
MALSGRIGYRSTPNSELSSQSIDLGNWPMVDENSLSAARKTKFLARKKAIELYLKGATDAVLQKKTGEKRSNIYRIITNRCLQRHSDGDIFGWRGALPHFRVTAYERQTAPVVHENGAGATGALKWLLERPQFKDLKDRFHKRILNNADSLAHPKINVQTIFRWFIDELRKAGLEDQKAWPFNSESLGYESVRLYIKKVLAEHPFLAMSKMGGA